jgi:hypothetical protein
MHVALAFGLQLFVFHGAPWSLGEKGRSTEDVKQTSSVLNGHRSALRRKTPGGGWICAPLLSIYTAPATCEFPAVVCYIASA